MKKHLQAKMLTKLGWEKGKDLSCAWGLGPRVQEGKGLPLGWVGVERNDFSLKWQVRLSAEKQECVCRN